MGFELQIDLTPEKSVCPPNSIPVPDISSVPMLKLPPPRKTAESKISSFLSATTNLI